MVIVFWIFRHRRANHKLSIDIITNEWLTVTYLHFQLTQSNIGVHFKSSWPPEECELILTLFKAPFMVANNSRGKYLPLSLLHYFHSLCQPTVWCWAGSMQLVYQSFFSENSREKNKTMPWKMLNLMFLWSFQSLHNYWICKEYCWGTSLSTWYGDM